MSYLNRANNYSSTGNVNGAEMNGYSEIGMWPSQASTREKVVTDKFADVLEAMKAELNRAVFKHGFRKVPINPEMDVRDSFIVLSEEVGEVARALTYDGGEGIDHLIEELTQVATMAAAMAVGLRLRGKDV